ncbi:hypothetical protein ACJKIH_03090 [Brucella pseudogrignonensis]|uniref:hypothetical protein n=1 Tax=Brucella pseudogrignonensis TaxID=419475 RepID=UPI0038B4AC25
MSGILVSRVTFHAVERYCSRILGVKCYPPKGTRPYDRAFLFAKAANLTVAEVRDKILTRNVERACRLGFKRMVSEGFTAVIVDGVVVSVVERRKPSACRKQRWEVEAEL